MSIFSKPLRVMTLCLFATSAWAQSFLGPITVDGVTHEMGTHAFPASASYWGYTAIKVEGPKPGHPEPYISDIMYDYISFVGAEPVILTYQIPIEDQPGDDILFATIRPLEYDPPTGGRHELEFSVDGVNYHRLTRDDFVLHMDFPPVLPNQYQDPQLYYQVYHARIDLANYGITGPVDTLYVRGVVGTGPADSYMDFAYAASLNQGPVVDNASPIVKVKSMRCYDYTERTVPECAFTIEAKDSGKLRLIMLKERFPGQRNGAVMDKQFYPRYRAPLFVGRKGEFTMVATFPAKTRKRTIFFPIHVVDHSGNRTVIVKKIRVTANGSIRILQ